MCKQSRKLEGNFAEYMFSTGNDSNYISMEITHKIMQDYVNLANLYLLNLLPSGDILKDNFSILSVWNKF